MNHTLTTTDQTIATGLTQAWLTKLRGTSPTDTGPRWRQRTEADPTLRLLDTLEVVVKAQTASLAQLRAARAAHA